MNRKFTLLFTLQDSSFIYNEADLLKSTKEINHDVMYREGLNFRVSVNNI